jgi:hypothetical protein
MNLSGFASRLLPALVLGCGVLSASTIVVTTDPARGSGGLVIRQDNTDTSLFFTGVIFISVIDNNNITFLRDSLCVDLFTEIVVTQTYNTTVLQPSMVPSKNLTRASWLVDNALLPTQVPTPVSVLDPSDWVKSIAQGEGIQLAIWDIVHDNGDGFGAGRVQAASTSDANNNKLGATDSTVLGWANTYEALSFGQSNNQAFVYNNFDTNGTVAQMLIGPQFFDGGPQPVPEPQTLMPMGIALIALSLGLRRGIRKRQ